MNTGIADQIRRLKELDQTLSEEDTAEALGVTAEMVRVATKTLNESDLERLEGVIRSIAMDESGDVPAKTKLEAAKWAIDEIKGRHDKVLKIKELAAMGTASLATAIENAMAQNTPRLRARPVQPFIESNGKGE